MKPQFPFHFQCPLCDQYYGCIDAVTQDEFDAKIANHIMNHHEDPAALRAVDRARIECKEVSCSLGKNKIWDKGQNCSVYKLTDYDQTFLHQLRVGWEE